MYFYYFFMASTIASTLAVAVAVTTPPTTDGDGGADGGCLLLWRLSPAAPTMPAIKAEVAAKMNQPCTAFPCLLLRLCVILFRLVSHHPLQVVSYHIQCWV